MLTVQTQTLLGAAFGIYLVSFTFIPMFGLPKLESYALITIFGALTSLSALIHSHFQVQRTALTRWALLLAAFLGIVGGSFLVNLSVYDQSTVQKVFGYSSIFLIASVPAVTQGDKYLKSCLAMCWVGLFLAMLIILLVNNRNVHNGRLIGPHGGGHVGEIGLHPNDVGQIAMVAVALAPAFGWRGVLLTGPLSLYTAFLANSRGSLLGILIALLTFAVAKEIFASGADWKRGLITRRALAIAGLVCVVALVLPALSWSFISEDVLRLNNTKRGVNSGLTGRTDVWASLFHRWQEKPLLGQGYGIVKAAAMQEESATDGGFLMVLAELGIFGFTYFVFMFGKTLLVSIKAAVRSRSNLSIALLVYTTTFCFINTLESRIVGTGSIGLGIFFLISGICFVDSESIVGQPLKIAWLEMSDEKSQAGNKAT